MFTYKCDLCGRMFESKSNRAKHCPACKVKAQMERNKIYLDRKRAKKSNAVGSMSACLSCGKPFIVNSGTQKYCPECAKDEYQKKKGQPTSDYIKEHYDYIRINVRKGEKDKINKYAKSQGMSVNQLFLRAVEEYKNNHD